jgi:hypothetical protein
MKFFSQIRNSFKRLAVASSVGTASLMALALSGVGLGEFFGDVSPAFGAQPVSPISPISVPKVSYITIAGAGFAPAVEDKQSPPTVTWKGQTNDTVTIDQRCTSVTKTVSGKAVVTAGCIKSWTDKAVVVAVQKPSGTNSDAVDVDFGKWASITVSRNGSDANAAGTGFDNNFYYVPVVTKISPQAGVVGGGTKVILTGVGFGTTQDTSLLKLDGNTIPASGTCSTAKTNCILKWTNTQIQFYTPPMGTNSKAAIQVLDGNGKGEVADYVDGYFYYGSVVTGVKPQ